MSSIKNIEKIPKEGRRIVEIGLESALTKGSLGKTPIDFIQIENSLSGGKTGAVVLVARYGVYKNTTFIRVLKIAPKEVCESENEGYEKTRETLLDIFSHIEYYSEDEFVDDSNLPFGILLYQDVSAIATSELKGVARFLNGKILNTKDNESENAEKFIKDLSLLLQKEVFLSLKKGLYSSVKRKNLNLNTIYGDKLKSEKVKLGFEDLKKLDPNFPDHASIVEYFNIETTYHQVNYVHGDLNVENVLVWENERGYLSCKLIDFGEVMPKKRDGFTPLFWDFSRLMGEIILNFMEESMNSEFGESISEDNNELVLQFVDKNLAEFTEIIYSYLSLNPNTEFKPRGKIEHIAKLYIATLFDFINEAKSGLKYLRQAEVIRDFFFCQILFFLFYTKFQNENIYKRLFSGKLALSLIETANASEESLYSLINSLEKFYFAFSLGTAINKTKQIGPLPGARSPFVGLSYFQEKDKEFFFGREKFIDEIVGAVERTPIVALAGASGSGKSSVIHAGVIPELRKKNYLIVKFRPGENPYYSVVHSLTEPIGDEKKWRQPSSIRELVSDILNAYPNHNLFLLGDQFEELYTLCLDQRQRDEFASELIEIAKEYKNRFKFLITIRSDFWTKLLENSDFSSVIGDSGANKKFGERFFLSSMTTEELRSAIEKPISIANLQIQNGLSDLILSSISNEPGGLPLLQFCLEELWKKQVDLTLNYSAYKEIGEVKGALATYAEQIYSNLNPSGQKRLKKIMLQLIQPGQGMEDTRRIALLEDILDSGSLAEADEKNASVSQEQIKEFINILADKRLIVTGTNESGKQTIEIVHEALIRGWSTLKGWIDADREFRVWQEKLRYAISEWELAKREDSLLFHGSNVIIAEDWLGKRRIDLSPKEIEFIEISKESRQRIIRKEKRLSRIITYGATAAAIIGLALSWFSFAQKKDAEVNKTKAEALFLTSNFKIKKDFLQSYFEILHSAIKHRGLDEHYSNAKLTLLSTLYNYVYNTGEIGSFSGHYSFVNSVKYSPDGKIIISASDDATIRIWDAATGKKLKTLSGHNSHVLSINISGDGKYIVSGSADKTVKIWEVETGSEIKSFTGHASNVSSVGFSPDGKLVVSASYDRTIKIWNVARGKAVKTLSGHKSSVNSVCFSPDGKQIASGSYDNTVKIWDVATGGIIRNLIAHSSYVWSVAFSPDGKFLASGSEDNTIQIWNANTGIEVFTLYGHSSYVMSVTFSPDGKLIASGSGDKAIKLWEVETGNELKTYSGHNSSVNSICFSPDGKSLVSGSPDKTIKIWEINMGVFGPIEREVKTLIGHSSSVWSANFSHDKKLIASSSSDKTIKIWDTVTGAELKTLSGHRSFVMSVSFSPDGKYLASGSADNTIKLWDVETGKELKTFFGHSSSIWSVSFSPKGNHIVSASGDKTIKLWDVNSGKEINTFSGHTKSIDSVIFSPDGNYLASASYDKTVKLWDVDSGKEIKTFYGHSSFVSSVDFSPNGKYLVSGSFDNTIKLWHIRTGREEKTFSGHGSTVNDVSFSPDGNYVASSSEDKTIKLWEIESGKEVKSLSGHSKSVDNVNFSFDGKLIVSASPDNTVKIWNMEISALLPIACKDMALQMSHWSTSKNPPYSLNEIEYVNDKCNEFKSSPLPPKDENKELSEYLKAKEELAVFFFNLGKETEAFSLAQNKEYLFLQRARTETGEQQIADYKKALEVNPNFLLAKDELSQIYFSNGQYELALELEKNKEYLYLYRARKYFKESQEEILSEIDKKNKIEKAKEDYLEALKINRKFQPAIADLSTIYQEEGHSKHKIGDYTGAIIDYQKALEIDPENVKAMYRWGIANHRLGNLDEAVVHFKKALKIYDNDSNAYVSLGFAQYDLGKKKDAIKNFEKAIEINPQNGPAFLGWAMVLSDNGQKEEATVKYIRARVNAPEDDEFLDWAARILLKKEITTEYELVEALSYAKRSNELDTNNAKYLLTLAEAYLRLDDKEEAQIVNLKAKKIAQTKKNTDLLNKIVELESKINQK